MSLCLLALSWSTFVWLVPVVLKVAIGLGAVIFVHELGHFLVAKACGVKVEKFMIGFDIGGYKLSWRRGETEYGIGILPLGGYVKMLGQDDDPAHIAEQMQKSQIDAHSGNAKAITGPDGETYYIDRRSYLAKSVPQRMAIISAGVIMNIIFAFIFAAVAYGMGVPYMPCIISETVPGSPAWEAGLEPGDEILKIGKVTNPTFLQLREGVMLGDLQSGLPLSVRRAANGETVEMTLKPVQKNGGLATIGIANPQTLKLIDALPVLDNSAAARATLVSPEGIVADQAKFKGGDEIVRIGAAPVTNYRELSAELARQPDQPLRITVRRKLANELEGGGESNDAESNGDRFQELTFEVPPQPLKQFGFDLQMGPTAAIRANSAAAGADVKPGDVIEQIDGNPAEDGGAASWSATTLSDFLRRAAQDKREVELTLRSSPGREQAEQTTVRLAPVVPITFNSPFPERSRGIPMATNEIGLAYRIENQLASVAPGSPAAAAGLQAGDKLVEAKLVLPPDKKTGTTPPPVVIDLGSDHPYWPTLLDLIQITPEGTEVEFKVQRANEAEPRTASLKPIAVEGAFLAARGFLFEPIERIRKATTIKEQVQYGWNETANALTMVFRFLKKLGTQVPMSALGGPITIAKAAGMYAAEGMPSLLIFLTTLSANLAVLNFLPIPLLDGGHMVFLAYEGLRGRPANEKFVVALHTVGFIFIVSLMLYVLALDLSLIPRNL